MDTLAWYALGDSLEESGKAGEAGVARALPALWKWAESARGVLCYVDGLEGLPSLAYFTTQGLEDQWGDDWDDAPYEFNAGPPTGPCAHGEGGSPRRDCPACRIDYHPDGTPRWCLSRVMFYSPNHDFPRSAAPGVSVERINRGRFAWLLAAIDCRRRDYPSGEPVQAGAGVLEFCQAVTRAGGWWLPLLV